MQLKDKTFEPFIREDAIQAEIRRMAREITSDFQDRHPLFMAVLNGAFMFAADLLKHISFPSEITFVKLKSYQGTSSTGTMHTLLGLDAPVANRHVIILEDIIDTGSTVQHLKELLAAEKPASVSIASLLFKPEALAAPLELHYVGIRIPNQFVVGYGLDYDGEGRNLRDIYRLHTAGF